MLDAGGAVAFQGELVVLAGEKLGVSDDLPVLAVSLLEGEGWAVEGVEAPVALDRAGDGEVGRCVRFGRRRSEGFLVLERLASVGFRDDEAAFEGIRGEGDVRWDAGAVDVEDKVMGEAGGEDEGGALEEQGHFGLQQAGDLVGVLRAEGREIGLLDSGQADDDDGLGVDEGNGGVELEV